MNQNLNKSISLRISEIASMIPPFKNIMDVGCDHGYLIIEAFTKHHIECAVACDNKSGPLSQAVNNISLYPFVKNVRFSLSDGISELDEKIEVVIIAGMGGVLITNILDKNKDKLKSIKRLVLQPNRNSYELRKFLMINNFLITNESIIYEDGKFYEIIQAEQAQNIRYSELELHYGPILLKKKSPVFMKKIGIELDKIKSLTVLTEENALKKERLEKIICL